MVSPQPPISYADRAKSGRTVSVPRASTQKSVATTSARPAQDSPIPLASSNPSPLHSNGQSVPQGKPPSSGTSDNFPGSTNHDKTGSIESTTAPSDDRLSGSTTAQTKGRNGSSTTNVWAIRRDKTNSTGGNATLTPAPQAVISLSTSSHSQHQPAGTPSPPYPKLTASRPSSTAPTSTAPTSMSASRPLATTQSPTPQSNPTSVSESTATQGIPTSTTQPARPFANNKGKEAQRQSGPPLPPASAASTSSVPDSPVHFSRSGAPSPSFPADSWPEPGEAAARPTDKRSEIQNSPDHSITKNPSGNELEAAHSHGSPSGGAHGKRNKWIPIPPTELQAAVDANRKVNEHSSPHFSSASRGRRLPDDAGRGGGGRGGGAGTRNSGGSKMASLLGSPAGTNSAFSAQPSPRSYHGIVPASSRSPRTQSPFIGVTGSLPQSPFISSSLPQSEAQSPRVRNNLLPSTSAAPHHPLSRDIGGGKKNPPVSPESTLKKKIHRPTPSQSSPVTGNAIPPLPQRNDYTFRPVFGTIPPIKDEVDSTGLGLALGSITPHLGEPSYLMEDGQVLRWENRRETQAEKILKEKGKYGIGVDASPTLPQHPISGGVAENGDPTDSAEYTSPRSDQFVVQPPPRRWEFGSIDRTASETPPILSPQPSTLVHPQHPLPFQLSAPAQPVNGFMPSPVDYSGYPRAMTSGYASNGRPNDDARKGTYASDGSARYQSNGAGNGFSRRGERGGPGRGGMGGRGGGYTRGRVTGASNYRPGGMGQTPSRPVRDGYYEPPIAVVPPPPNPGMVDYIPTMDMYSPVAPAHPLQSPMDISQPSPFMPPPSPYGYWVVPQPLGVGPYAPPFGQPYGAVPSMPPMPYGQPLPPVAGGYSGPAQPPIPMPVSLPPYPLDPLRFYILGQVEYYFSTQNLIQDIFLRKQMDSQGWIDINVIASFNRVRQLTQDYHIVRETMAISPLIEVSGDKVRVANGAWEQFLLPGQNPTAVAENTSLPVSSQAPAEESSIAKDVTESSSSTIVGSSPPTSTTGVEAERDSKIYNNASIPADLGTAPA